MHIDSKRTPSRCLPLLALPLILAGCQQEQPAAHEAPLAPHSAAADGPSVRVNPHVPAPPLVVAALKDAQVPATSWPDACSLISRTSLADLLPDASDIHQQGSKGKFFDGSATPKNATCTYTFVLTEPGTTTASRTRSTAERSSPGPTVQRRTSTVSVSLTAVADPQLLQADLDQRRRDLSRPAQAKISGFVDYQNKYAASCLYDGVGLLCAAGSVQYEIAGTPTGATVSRNQATQWRETVLGPIATFIAHRIQLAPEEPSATPSRTPTASPSGMHRP